MTRQFDKEARDPHSALNNSATEPDETEYPDPYDKRPDPRSPDMETDAIPEGEPNDSAQRGSPAAPSTSEPHPEDWDDLHEGPTGESGVERR